MMSQPSILAERRVRKTPTLYYSNPMILFTVGQLFEYQIILLLVHLSSRRKLFHYVSIEKKSITSHFEKSFHLPEAMTPEFARFFKNNLEFLASKFDP